jgi:hypothetical protein
LKGLRLYAVTGVLSMAAPMHIGCGGMTIDNLPVVIIIEVITKTPLFYDVSSSVATEELWII